jgi:hypothetical protein
MKSVGLEFSPGENRPGFDQDPFLRQCGRESLLATIDGIGTRILCSNPRNRKIGISRRWIWIPRSYARPILGYRRPIDWVVINSAAT